MRKKSAQRITAGRTRKAFTSVKQAARFTLVLALVAQCLPFEGASRAVAQVRTTASTIVVPPQAQQAGSDVREMPSEPIAPVEATIVSFKELSKTMGRNTPNSETSKYRAVHSPGTRPEPDAPGTPSHNETPSAIGIAKPMQPDVASPAPSQSFLAQEDGPKIGGSTFTIPPDTMGAVGLDKVFTQTNSNFRIHNKLTGLPLSTVDAETFWSATGASGVFDPRVQYDPYQNRWITAIVSNASSAQSSILVGVSQTSDPQGTWLLFRVVVGFAIGSAAPFANGGWADFPMLGFNKNWIAIGYNMHAITNNAFVRGEVLVLNYPSARAGVLSGSRVNLGGNFCVHPATTLSSTENTLYLLQQASSAAASIVAYTISGTPSTISINQFGTFTRPGGGWVAPVGDLLPQNCIPGSPVATFQCPPTPRKLETSDSQIRGNVVFRNGKLFYSQTVGIDLAGGDPVDHTAAQWTVITPTFTPPPGATLSVSFTDGGRVEDATATATNGGKWYSYTSLAVNRNDEVLLGFSEFESDDFVDAGYTFRAAADAAGTMRDTFIYKEGEDYYDKDFGTGRNRFGDYSHAVVDPVNDTDLWTVQEYTQPRVVAVPPTVDNPAGGLGSNSSRWSTWWAKIALAVPGATGDLVISEFRLRGPGGAEDEYIEIYNKTTTAITVTTTDGSAGYGLAASDGIVRFTIPNGTVIPPRGHYLGVNSDGYSLSSYPAGLPTNAAGDVTYTDNIPDNGTGEGGLYRGIALFNTSNPGNFNTLTRFDAVGPTSEANALYRENAGHTPLSPNFNTENAWVRDVCGKQGNMATAGVCPSGFPLDTDNNATDFFFVDTAALSAGVGQRLGAPGPENLSSPIYTPAAASLLPLDTTQGSGLTAAPPGGNTRNFVRNPAVVTNGLNGTISLRRRLVNNSGESITRLRFRVVDITTFPPAGNADLRVLTSAGTTVTGVNDPATCPGGITPCTVTVQPTTLETPPTQGSGGGFNSSISAGTVIGISPLATGNSVNLEFLLGVQVTGNFRFAILAEGLTTTGRGVAAGVDYYQGNTDSPTLPTAARATISGAVTTASGQPLAGVTVRLNGGQSATAITDAAGNYHFDKLGSEQFYTVTPARVNYHFNPEHLAFSLPANKTDAVFTGIPDAAIVGNAIDSSEYFVRQHYLDFLGREPDETGFNFWSNQILSCGGDAGCAEAKRINVSAAYFLSVEFQRTGGLVDGLYRASFGRAPKYAEFIPDTAAMARNIVVGKGDWEGDLATNQRALVQSFVNRPAFRAAYDGLANAGYVDALIGHTGISFSQPERDVLVNDLNSGSSARAEVLMRIAENERFVAAKRNARFVLMEYFGYLRRDPDANGYDFWLNKLNQFEGNFERAEMVKAFVTSGEYRARFAR